MFKATLAAVAILFGTLVAHADYQDGRGYGGGYPPYNGGHGGHGGGYPPGNGGGYQPQPGNGSLQAYFQYCQNYQLCTYNISWFSSYSQNTIVTVQVPEETNTQTLFACGAQSGQQIANWIKPGKRYIFRMFNSNDCYSQVWNWQPTSAVLDFVGGR